MTPADRPWFSCSQPGLFRMRSTDTAEEEQQLLDACERQATLPPIQTCRGLPFLDAGWEWSVFRDGGQVIKIPAGRFPEVNHPQYLENAALNYQKLLRFVDRRFLAETQFLLGEIHQEWIEAQEIEHLDLSGLNTEQKNHFRQLFVGLLQLLRSEQWLPDLEILPQGGKFLLKNLLITQSGIPRVVDFTSYCDRFRLSEHRLEREIALHEAGLREALRFVEVVD